MTSGSGRKKPVPANRRKIGLQFGKLGPIVAAKLKLFIDKQVPADASAGRDKDTLAKAL